MIDFEIKDRFQLPEESVRGPFSVNAIISTTPTSRYITEYVCPMSFKELVEKIEYLYPRNEYVEWFLIDPRTSNRMFIAKIIHGVFFDWCDRQCIHDRKTDKWHYYGYYEQPFSLGDLSLPIEKGFPGVDGFFEDGVLLKDGAFFRKGANDMFYLHSYRQLK